MRLTPIQAKKLAHLADGRSLPRSELAERLRAPLLEAGAIRLERSGSSARVRGVPGRLEAYVEREWGIRDLHGLAEAAPEKRSRSLMAEVAGDSKALPNRPFDGLFFRSFGGCMFLDEAPLGASPAGSAIWILESELPRLRVTGDLLIGIENPACLWEFERAASQFPRLTGRSATLVLRWHWRAAWKAWLSGWSGEFLYFGDYDPAGLRIFASEVLTLQPGARLLMPENLGALIEARGSRELYLRQEKALRSLPAHPDIEEVTALLKLARKGVEQEMLLRPEGGYSS